MSSNRVKIIIVIVIIITALNNIIIMPDLFPRILNFLHLHHHHSYSYCNNRGHSKLFRLSCLPCLHLDKIDKNVYFDDIAQINNNNA